MNRFFHVLLLMALSSMVLGQYSISGKVNISEGWQPKVYLAAVNKLSDYYRTSPDMILNTAAVDAEGRFHLEGDNIPTDPRYYRLYLMKDQNTDYDACLYVGGDDHNFVHIILKNGETVEIVSDTTSIAPFGEYTVKGGSENQAMRALSGIVFPSFYFYRIKFPTELKFSEDKFHTDLRNYADSSSHTLVALAAVNNMDLDEYFDRDEDFFQGFGKRLKRDFPNSVYTKNYLAKMRYYANEGDEPSTWPRLLIALLSFGLLGALLIILRLQKEMVSLRSTSGTENAKTETQLQTLDQSLTQKEREILQLINAGKSNKDIAAELFVEVSTVKTHINKLYSKIGVSNRSEAQVIANQLFS